jgi:hypothetical protein
MKNQFKLFLLTEEKIYLGQRIGDILTALQQLNDDAANMGKRHLIRIVTNIVSQIRRILHSSWSYEEEKYLKQLQKVGVALMKGIDSNEDLIQTVSNCASAVEKLSDDLDAPINNLAAPAHSDFSYDDDQDDD